MYRGFGGSPAQKRMSLGQLDWTDPASVIAASKAAILGSSGGAAPGAGFPGATQPARSITVNKVAGTYVQTASSPPLASPAGYVWTQGGNSGGVYAIQPGYYSSAVWAQILINQAIAMQTGAGADIIAGIPPGQVSKFGLAYLGYAGDSSEFLEAVGYTDQFGGVSANVPILDAMVFAACGGSGSPFAQALAQMFGIGAPIPSALQMTMLSALGYAVSTSLWPNVVAYAQALHPDLLSQTSTAPNVNPGEWDGQGVQDLFLDYWTEFPPGSLGATQIAAAQAVFQAGSYVPQTQTLSSSGTTAAFVYTPPAGTVAVKSSAPVSVATSTSASPAPKTGFTPGGAAAPAPAAKSNTLLYGGVAAVLAALAFA